MDERSAAVAAARGRAWQRVIRMNTGVRNKNKMAEKGSLGDE